MRLSFFAIRQFIQTTRVVPLIVPTKRPDGRVALGRNSARVRGSGSIFRRPCPIEDPVLAAQATARQRCRRRRLPLRQVDRRPRQLCPFRRASTAPAFSGSVREPRPAAGRRFPPSTLPTRYRLVRRQRRHIRRLPRLARRRRARCRPRQGRFTQHRRTAFRRDTPRRIRMLRPATAVPQPYYPTNPGTTPGYLYPNGGPTLSPAAAAVAALL